MAIGTKVTNGGPPNENCSSPLPVTASYVHLKAGLPPIAMATLNKAILTHFLILYTNTITLGASPWL